jgi:hypothetical protein
MKKLHLALTVDVDPDNFDVSIFGADKRLSWRGVDEKVPELLEVLNPITDSLGNPPRITWFVRADSELHRTYGSYTYLFEKYNSLWKEREARGEEIAWHPHIETVRELDDSFNSLKKLGRTVTSVRMGMSLGSNDFMEHFSSYGFRVDSTALPGRKRLDTNRVFDWLSTPEKPYFPSREDYRVPGDTRGDILEVPFTMMSTKADYDTEVCSRYLNLSYRQSPLTKNSLSRLAREKELLVMIVHPSELLPPKEEHSLLSFDLSTVIANLTLIVEQAKKYDRNVVYTTLSDVVDLVHQGSISYANN